MEELCPSSILHRPPNKKATGANLWQNRLTAKPPTVSVCADPSGVNGKWETDYRSPPCGVGGEGDDSKWRVFWQIGEEGLGGRCGSTFCNV